MSFRGPETIDAGGETLEADVCIIGSGAGGSVLAAGLAQQGHRVVVVEAGPYRQRTDFTLQERDSMRELYQESGGRSTADGAFTILQGRSVGGSTTVNWTSCFRTPDSVLAHWQSEHGLTELTTEALAPHFEAVEERLNIREWPESQANPNNQVLYRGARALGWDVGPIRRNVKGCANSGYCGMGCPVDGKQAMHVTYLRDAVDAGATVLSEVQVERIEHRGGQAGAVLGRVHRLGEPQPNGPTVRVDAKVVVVSGGAINSPALLLRSGIGAGLPLGKRTFLHPVIAVLGVYAQEIHPWYGAPQTAHSHEFIDRGPGKIGFFLESVPIHPMLAGTAFRPFGAEQWSLMKDLKRIAGILVLHQDGMLPDDIGGEVTLDSHGRAQLMYPVREALLEALLPAHMAATEMHFAAGAQTVITGHTRSVVMKNATELPVLRSVKYGAMEHSLFTAHQMGGCTMGEKGVVGMDHRVYGFDNLFVVDGSVLPTSLGVNPSETVYALAHRARAMVGAAIK